ncbi:unnamed protein product, partial [Didymodactylos carnosus]
LPLFVSEQKLVLQSEEHECPKCGSEMRDGKRQKTLKNEIIWLWCANISSKTISWTVGCSGSTVVDWSNFLREVCTEKLNMAPQMGGIGEVVQIDESLFRGKRKYNRGRLLLGNQNNNGNNNATNGLVPYASSSENSDGIQQQTNNRNYGRRMDGPWIFGIAQPTEDGHEVRFFHVQRRDRQTLVPIIWKHVVPGTTVWSDEWAACKNLQTQYGYDHQT